MAEEGILFVRGAYVYAWGKSAGNHRVTIEFDFSLMPEGGGELLGAMFGNEKGKEMPIAFMLKKAELPEPEPVPETKQKPKPKQERVKKSLTEMTPAQKLHLSFFKNERFWAYLTDQRNVEVLNEEDAKRVFKIWAKVESTNEIKEEQMCRIAERFNAWLKENREAVTHG